MEEPIYYRIQKLQGVSAELDLMCALEQCMNLSEIDANDKARAARWLSDKYPLVKAA